MSSFPAFPKGESMAVIETSRAGRVVPIALAHPGWVVVAPSPCWSRPCRGEMPSAIRRFVDRGLAEK